MMATGDSRDTTNNDEHAAMAAFDDWFDDKVDSTVPCTPGQHFHVDFGFMKGSGY